MEFKEYLKIIKKNSALVITLVILGALGGYFYAATRESGYKTDQTFFLSVSSAEEATKARSSDQPSQASSEAYFAQEQARNFTDTAIALLESPDFIQETLSSGAYVSPRKLAPQVIRITTIASTKEESAANALKVQNSFNAKLQELSQTSLLQIKPIASASEPAFTVASKKIYTLFGFILGFTFSLLAISLKQYFKL